MIYNDTMLLSISLVFLDIVLLLNTIEEVTVKPVLGKHQREEEKLISSGRLLLSRGKLVLNMLHQDVRFWPFKTGSCAKKVVFKTGLSVSCW